jgi:acetyltransferase-like isoleucine patch superfamily enzyme
MITMDKKYVMLNKEEQNGLHRIVALRSFTTVDGTEVHEGDFGGLIHSESNLSHLCSCWVDFDSMVFDNATVSDNALITGQSQVFDSAIIEHEAVIKDDSSISNEARVGGNAIVCSSRVDGQARIIKDAVVTNTYVTGSNTVVESAVCTPRPVFRGHITKPIMFLDGYDQVSKCVKPDFKFHNELSKQFEMSCIIEKEVIDFCSRYCMLTCGKSSNDVQELMFENKYKWDVKFILINNNIVSVTIKKVHDSSGVLEDVIELYTIRTFGDSIHKYNVKYNTALRSSTDTCLLLNEFLKDIHFDSADNSTVITNQEDEGNEKGCKGVRRL